MYSMPIVGTSARLYFPDESGNEPLISGCVRNNGSSCAKTSDTSKRYFGTEHGSEVEMTPSALNIKGGSASPISISIDDATGITITSPKKLTLSADSEIVMKTPKNVKINGVSQINAVKTGTESGFSLEGDLNILSDNVKKEGSSNEAYSDHDDDPVAGQMPEAQPKTEQEHTEKSGFSWGKLALVAVAAVAVVASVFTFGATATVAAVAIGAIAASAAVGAYKGAKNSIDSQKSANKDVDYLDVIKAAFCGAVTGATDMVKTEACSVADWTVQTVLGTLGLLNEASKYLPFTRNDVAYQISADQTRDMLNNTSKYMHQFFKDLAPYQDAYEYGEDFLNLVSIANGVKSLGNMAQKGMGGISIGNMQIANTNIVVPVLSYSGEAIAGVSDVASISIAGSSIYNMSNSNGAAGSKSLNEDLIDDDGTFKDPELEEAYNKYVKNKKKAGEEPRDRENWKEASDWWKKIRKQGEKFAKEQFDEFQKEYSNAQKEVTIKINNKEGTKIRVDAIAKDKKGNIIIQEYKSSETAPYTKNQESGFPDLYKYGGEVVGNGKEGFAGGTPIPSGTDVEVVRPSGKKLFNAGKE